MIGVDTNVLVRLLVQGDSASQTAAARRLFAENRVAVAYTVLLETEWVLRGTFGFPRAEIAGALLRLLGMPTVFFDRRDAVLNALRSFENGIDFADALHVATSASNLAEFATFDRDFARLAGRHALAPPVRLLPN